MRRPSQALKNVPFRFKNAIPVTYKQEFYMELSSDSENEEDDSINMSVTRKRMKDQQRTTKRNSSIGSKRQGSVVENNWMGDENGSKPPQSNNPKQQQNKHTNVKICFKHEKIINRERPISAQLFRTLADTDPEFKVRTILKP